jgi:hypothetical protein
MASHAMLSLMKADERNNDEAERRRAPRYRVLLTAQLITIAGEQPVKLRDISMVGALIEGEKLPPPGKDVVLRRGSIETFASVAWVRGNRCGLLFDDSFTESEMMAFINKPAPMARQMPIAQERPTLASDIITPEQWEMIQAWGRPTDREALRP